MKEPIFADVRTKIKNVDAYHLYIGSSIKEIEQAHIIYSGSYTVNNLRRVRAPWFEVFNKVYKNGVENGRSDFFMSSVKEYFELVALDTKPQAVLVYISNKRFS